MPRVFLTMILGALASLPSPAADDPSAAGDAAAHKKWSNSTELSLVVTQGNSNTETVGFKNTLIRSWKIARFRLKLEATLSNTADDRYAVADCGDLDPVTCFDTVQADPDSLSFTVVEPAVEPDVEKYFVEGRYDRELGTKLFWNVGASWFRDVDAGIENLYLAFGGLGHRFWDREDLKFDLTYGLSFTERQEEDPDPVKDDRFPGFRFGWDYLNQWGKVTTFTHDLTVNFNITDVEDYSVGTTGSISVSMNKVLALKVSLQFLYNNLPALEEIDLYLDPNQFIDPQVEVDVRRKQLDTVFNTSLVISF